MDSMRGSFLVDIDLSVEDQESMTPCSSLVWPPTWLPSFARTCTGHRMLLVQYHTHVLAREEGGAWTKYSRDEYTERLQTRL